jgi:transcriptional regulator with XRE-family HTH domain
VKKIKLTSEQILAARMLLRWEQTDLAAKSGMSLSTIKRIELIPGEFGAYETTLAAIKMAFESEGISFFNGICLGVRLRKRDGSNPRKSTPAVSGPASKPVKTIKKAAKKAR